MFGSLLQIITAIILVLLLFALGFFIYNMELVNSFREFSEARTIKRHVPIMTGIRDIKDGLSFNTSDKTSWNFKDILPSFNQPSGAEFTYNFWLYKDNTAFPEPTDKDAAKYTDHGLTSGDFVLILHGDKNAYTYNNICGAPKNDIKIKCPLVKLERGGDVLTVEFNTISSPDVVREQARNVCREYSTDWAFMNAHKVAIKGFRNPTKDKKWNMVTVIIQDTSPNDPLPIRNKIRCRIYVNGVMELDRYVDSGLGLYSGQSLIRRNSAYLHVAPRINVRPFQYTAPGVPSAAIAGTTLVTTNNINVANPDKLVLMADLSYFNYAVDTSDVISMYNKGFTRTWYTQTAANLAEHAMQSALLNVEKVQSSGKSEYSTLS